MALFYSASTPGFFDDAIHGDLPADAVPITRARHAELLAAQASGAAIVAGNGGRPRVERRRVAVDDLRAALVLKVKREAGRRIEAVSPLWRQLNDLREPRPRESMMSDAAAARFRAIDAIREASGWIEEAIADATLAELQGIDISNHPAWPVSVEDADA